MEHDNETQKEETCSTNDKFNFIIRQSLASSTPAVTLGLYCIGGLKKKIISKLNWKKKENLDI